MSEAALDTTCIGVAAAKLMEQIAEDYPAAQISLAAVVVEISFEDDEGDQSWALRWRFVNSDGTAATPPHISGVARYLDDALAPP